MTDEERAEHVLSCLSSNYHIDATRGAFTRRESDVSALAAAFRAIRDEAAKEVWAEVHSLLCRDGWDMTLDKIKAYCERQAHGTPGEGGTE